MFDIMNRVTRRSKRMSSMRSLLTMSKLVREDMSKYYLRNLKNDGYSQVVFTSNPAADPECKVLDRNIYDIDDLLRLDNPLFRVSHPNCLCKFDPYGSTTSANTPQTTEDTGMPGGGGNLPPRP